MEELSEREKSRAFGPSDSKAGGECVHIKQNADGPEESCPMVL